MIVYMVRNAAGEYKMSGRYRGWAAPGRGGHIYRTKGAARNVAGSSGAQLVAFLMQEICNQHDDCRANVELAKRCAQEMVAP